MYLVGVFCCVIRKTSQNKLDRKAKVTVDPRGIFKHAGCSCTGPLITILRVRRGCQWIAMVLGKSDPIVGDAEAR